MVDVYENIDDYNPSRKRKILIAFDDMIVGIMTNKKLKATFKELFIRCRKLNVSLFFYTVLFFCSKRCQISLFDYEINNNKELQKIAINDSADIDYKYFVNIYRECTKNRILF